MNKEQNYCQSVHTDFLISDLIERMEHSLLCKLEFIFVLYSLLHSGNTRGWSFYWYKAVPDLSHKSASYSYELLPASSNGTADNSYIIHGQTHTAGYVCRAGRGEPHVSTLYSQPDFVWSGDLHPSASLSVSPDRVQHFTSDSLSLTCEGNSAEWRVGSFLLPDLLSFCSDWGTMNGSTCHVQKIQSSNAVFWCESGSAFSNAVNITGHNDDLILLSPVHPVTEGHSLTLGCKWRTENLLSKVVFYQNDTLIQSESRVEMIIPAVSKSHEGGSSLFGSHRDPEEIQNDPEDENKGESRKITYSSIKLKAKKKKRQKPAEMIVYSDVKTGASAGKICLYMETCSPSMQLCLYK
ncbi:hypothetical protein OJAV_G00179120 [Oryzias javanicus]|uniref:Ig-like domain-containing protein n=1 Tax=Oryzias javanicus TaxID=123683 RepID=A0A3S2MIM7_ORYJA|nr:hypothetical protein OJAV_G00179120 [Oryzias javanicus]